MSLETPDKIRTLQRKLYVKAKAEPEFRFYLLHDKICRADILAHAFALARRNDGSAGVDSTGAPSAAGAARACSPGTSFSGNSACSA